MTPFSQRLGITPVRTALQGQSLDPATRNRLWSAFAETLPEAQGTRLSFRGTWMWQFCREVWAEFFKLPVDNMPLEEWQVRAALKAQFINAPWNEVYDLLEFAVHSKRHGDAGSLAERVKHTLEEEKAGFRLVDGQFVQIADEAEIAAIEDGLRATAGDRFTPARVHLTTALQHFSSRTNPDYRNSVKESISAVEAIAQIISDDPRASLDDALRVMEARAPLHGALKSALRSLYGYTSDAEGIRHALTEAPNLNAADAKFMLVACTAFVTYLIQKTAPQ